MAITTRIVTETVRDEFQANFDTLGDQSSSDVVGLAAGGYALTLVTNNGAGSTQTIIYASPTDTAPVVATSGSSSNLSFPSVVQLAGGKVAFVWGSGAGTVTKIIDPNTGVSSAEEIVETIGFGAHVTALADGNFLVASTSQEVLTQYLVSPNGEPLSSAVVSTSGFQQASVAQLTGGRIVHTFTISGSTVSFIITNPDGSDPLVGQAEVQVSSNASFSQVAALKNGNFAVVFDSDNLNGTPGIGMKIYTADGIDITPGGTIRVDSFPANDEKDPDITVLESGHILVSWTDVFSPSDSDALARLYDQDGNLVQVDSGTTIIFNTTGLNETQTSIAALKNGQFVATWTDEETDGNGSRISGVVREFVNIAQGEDTANDVYLGTAMRDFIDGGEGNDRLGGGAGTDTLTGGLGNDTYVNPTGDIIIERESGGNDTVESNTTASLAIREQVENLTLTGLGNINATGNAGANVLIGNAGNNILNGGLGADTMAGGAGNDTYYVDTAGDVTTEPFNHGIDIVSSSISRTLSVNVENLNLSGAANIDGNGNTAANRINGNDGNNVLRGYEGADTLNGGAGNDILLGGTSSDSLNPGSDAVRDIIRFGAVTDSTGSQRDIITGLDLNNEDRLDFTVIPTSLATVNTGTLSLAIINANLASAVNAALAVNGAVLFDPSAGDLNVAGHKFLVVDANGDGSYTPSADYVVQLVNATGTLTLDDFI